MAPDGVEEPDYESDPEELKRSLATRRREASDDDVDEKREIDSDEQSGVVESDNDGEDEDEDDLDLDLDYIADNDKPSVAGKAKGVDDTTEDSATDVVDQKKKETAGAFYMHDERFQEIDAASSSNSQVVSWSMPILIAFLICLSRRMRGGRRLWQSRDERKWGHDRYEEMNTQYDHSRSTSRGRVQGRGQERGRGYSLGTNSKPFTGNQFPKTFSRGRGRSRYEVALRYRNQAPSLQTKQSQKSFVNLSHVDSTETANIETEAIQAKNNVLASTLTSASPPFYPSGSSNNLAQKDLQVGMNRLHVSENHSPSGKKFRNTKASLLRLQVKVEEHLLLGKCFASNLLTKVTKFLRPCKSWECQELLTKAALSLLVRL